MPATLLARAASSTTSVDSRSNGACSSSITTKSQPSAPRISVACVVGVLMKEPTTLCRAEKRRRNDEKCGLTTSPDNAVPPGHLGEPPLRRLLPAWRLAKIIAAGRKVRHSYSAPFHQVEF